MDEIDQYANMEIQMEQIIDLMNTQQIILGVIAIAIVCIFVWLFIKEYWK